MLVEGVHGHLGAAGDDLGLELAAGATLTAADLPVEDDLDGVRAAEIEVVGDQRLEEAAGVAGLGEHQRAGHLDLRHRQLPPVAGVVVGRGQRQRQPSQPAVEEHVDRARPETVADRLQRGGIVGVGEPVGQFGEPDSCLCCLAFGPFVSVHPDLDRPRAVGADLDEGGAEIGVPQVEVEDGDPAVLLVEGELRRLGRVGVTLPGDEHPLRLLRDPDRGHLRTPLAGSRTQIAAHHVDVAVGGLQPHHRDVVRVGERGDRPAEPVTDLLQTRRRRDRKTALPQELHHLPADLELTEVAVQVDPIQAVQVEFHVPVEHIVDRDRIDPNQTCRHHDLRN